MTKMGKLMRDVYGDLALMVDGNAGFDGEFIKIADKIEDCKGFENEKQCVRDMRYLVWDIQKRNGQTMQTNEIDSLYEEIGNQRLRRTERLVIGAFLIYSLGLILVGIFYQLGFLNL